MVVPETLFWVLGLGWVLFSLVEWRSLGLVEPLPEVATPAQPEAQMPRVSVIIPARDEAERVEQTVVKVLAQTGISLELLLVNDRSSDHTPEIMAALAATDPRIKVITISELPEQWLGKPYACQRAAEQGTGDWILFTDADTWMAPDVIIRAVRAAESENADHVTLIPGEGHATLPAQAMLSLLHAFFAFGFARVNRDKKNAFCGAGAFNMVRASAYRSIDGHNQLKLEVIDDVGLGKLLNQAGFRTRMYNASHELEVVWCAAVRTLIHVLEKNMFSLFRFNLLQATLFLLFYMAVWLIPLAAPFTGTAAGIAAFAGLASITIPAVRAARLFNLRRTPALFCLALYPSLGLALLNSVAKTLRHGGITWRNTFYPLEDLRRGLCTRNWFS
jgi:cellulose synthase/poly-beta-1,6-N-acetylglucosamine synthase-like glycosyltransferase